MILFLLCQEFARHMPMFATYLLTTNKAAILPDPILPDPILPDPKYILSAKHPSQVEPCWKLMELLSVTLTME